MVDRLELRSLDASGQLVHVRLFLDCGSVIVAAIPSCDITAAAQAIRVNEGALPFSAALMHQIEINLAAHGTSAGHLCDVALIARTTWHRWKNGSFKPSFEAWRRTTEAYQTLIAPANDTPTPERTG